MIKIPVFLKKYRWGIFLIIPLLIFLYWQPGKWFSEPASTVLYDRDGLFLGAKISADDQWRFPECDSVPEKFRKAIICGEDRYFFYHPGFNPVSLARAAFQYVRERKIISGGSTLSMQVVRMSGKNRNRSFWRKLREIIQAFRLELTHSKDEILALYASHAPFGGNVVGLEAAAWRYYGIPSENLSWSQTATLAVLPNSPALIYPGKNQIRLKKKRDALLEKLFQRGIIDKIECDLAKSEPLPGKPYPLPRLAPHLVERAAREGYAGKPVATSIKKNLQQKVNEILEYHSKQLRGNEINNAAALVVDVESGEILAYAGNIGASGDSEAEDVDIITSPRSTGSILKPLLYAAALNDGIILPNTLLPDIPMQIGGFMPENYSQTYDGAVPAKMALARSLNIPAVKLLQMYGYDQLYGKLKKLGMTTLTKPADHYGLSLILGGAETTLWDLAGIYSSMAKKLNHSEENKVTQFHPPVFIKSDDKKNSSVATPMPDPASIWFTFEAMTEVMRPEEELQWQQFSSGSRIAWKTGTSYGNRDAWAVGVTPRYVVAVWAGNATGEGRPGLTGTGCAAPILFDIFRQLASGEWFSQPFDEMIKVPVCRYSGYRASSICEFSDTVWIPLKGLRTSVCPFHRLVHLDPSGTWQVTSSCVSPSQMQHRSWFVLPPAQEWYFRTKNPFYKNLPPFMDGCSGTASATMMEMIYPENNSKIYIPVDIDGRTGSSVFHLAHRDPSKKVYWNLDDKFLGVTSGENQMALAPSKGIHILMLTDETGENLKIKFEVISR